MDEPRNGVDWEDDEAHEEPGVSPHDRDQVREMYRDIEARLQVARSMPPYRFLFGGTGFELSLIPSFVFMGTTLVAPVVMVFHQGTGLLVLLGVAALFGLRVAWVNHRVARIWGRWRRSGQLAPAMVIAAEPRAYDPENTETFSCDAVVTTDPSFREDLPGLRQLAERLNELARGGSRIDDFSRSVSERLRDWTSPEPDLEVPQSYGGQPNTWVVGLGISPGLLPDGRFDRGLVFCLTSRKGRKPFTHIIQSECLWGELGEAMSACFPPPRAEK